MPDTWVTDITHFLDEEGDIAGESAPAIRFAEYLVSIISLISHPKPVPVELSVSCRRRPHRKPCKGQIEGHIAPYTEDIVWWCPLCGDSGFITNWKGTIWDLSEAGNTPH